MARLGEAVRTTLAALRDTLANDGIRRLELGWSLGIAADAALSVVLLVIAYQRGGVVATGLLGASRMVPAVVVAMFTGALLQHVSGRALLLAIAVIRAAAALVAVGLIVADAPLPWLFVLAAVVGAAGAPVVAVSATLMPAVARSPTELVAANVAWGTGEGAGALAGSFLAGILIAGDESALVAAAAAIAFALTGVAVLGLRFEQVEDAAGGGRGSRSLRLRDGLAVLRRRAIVRWTMLAVYGQVLTRGVLNTLAVVAAIELLGMGEGGVGLLNAALGLGGLFGAVLAMSTVRTHRLVRAQTAALAYWGAPIAVIGLWPVPAVGLAAMVVIGVANALFDVSIHTLLQRASTNAERAPVFSILESSVGLGALTGSLLGPVIVAAFGVRLGLAVTGTFLPILALVVYGRLARLDKVTAVDESLVDLLREVEAFRALPMTAIERVAAGARPASFAAGSVLMREGEPGDQFVVIEDGEVEVSIGGHGVHRMGHGSGLGEIALVRRSARTATVTALTPISCFCVDAPTFLAAVSGPAAGAQTERIATAHLLRDEAMSSSAEATSVAG